LSDVEASLFILVIESTQENYDGESGDEGVLSHVVKEIFVSFLGDDGTDGSCEMQEDGDDLVVSDGQDCPWVPMAQLPVDFQEEEASSSRGINSSPDEAGRSINNREVPLGDLAPLHNVVSPHPIPRLLVGCQLFLYQIFIENV